MPAPWPRWAESQINSSCCQRRLESGSAPRTRAAHHPRVGRFTSDLADHTAASSRKLRQRCLRRIFVLSGTWWVNSGDDFDPKNAVPVPAGGFVKRTARTPLRRSANSMSTGPMPKIAMTTPTLRIDLGRESLDKRRMRVRSGLIALPSL